MTLTITGLLVYNIFSSCQTAPWTVTNELLKSCTAGRRDSDLAMFHHFKLLIEDRMTQDIPSLSLLS